MQWAAKVNPKAKAFVEGRKKGWKELEQFSAQKKPTIWIHCASLGEFEQGRPIIEALKMSQSKYSILLTFYSPSGYEVRKNYTHADLVTYLPIDTLTNAQHFLDLIQPSLAIFVKYEFWHNYIHQIAKRGIPLISISAIFRKEQRFFKNKNNFFNHVLRQFNHIFTQDEESLHLLHSIDITQASKAGDTRFDRVITLSNEPYESPELEEFKGTNDIMVIGSSWEADEKLLIPFIQEHISSLKFIIAPHEINESHIEKLMALFPKTSIKWSEMNEKSNFADYRILIVDTIGQLSHLYRFGKYAYVGGAFGAGLHNILEPACYGLPVFFGNKNFTKFKEAVDLLEHGGAFSIGSTKELEENFRFIEKDSNYLKVRNNIHQYVNDQKGATELILNHMKQWIS